MKCMLVDLAQFLAARDPMVFVHAADKHPSRTLVVRNPRKNMRRSDDLRVKKVAGRELAAEYSDEGHGWIIQYASQIDKIRYDRERATT